MDSLLTIGQLASRAGLTVRALHHYEDLGLLAPSRTEAGHRRYGPCEVERVQQIRSLQSLGVPLREIRAALDAPNFDPAALVARQREAVEAEAARLGDLAGRLRTLHAYLQRRAEAGTPVPPDAFLQTLHAMQDIERHYTPEQLDQLKARADELGEDTIRAVEAEWPQLFEKVGREMDAGTDPTDPRARTLIDRWDELVAMFTNHDPGITQALGTVWRESGGSASRMAGLDPDRMRDLFAYAQRVRDARE
ncbi:MAG: MerR family transcriptional regulator [Bacteroidota bacterium]